MRINDIFNDKENVIIENIKYNGMNKEYCYDVNNILYLIVESNDNSTNDSLSYTYLDEYLDELRELSNDELIKYIKTFLINLSLEILEEGNKIDLNKTNNEYELSVFDLYYILRHELILRKLEPIETILNNIKGEN